MWNPLKSLKAGCERERERERCIYIYTHIYVYICVYIYIGRRFRDLIPIMENHIEKAMEIEWTRVYIGFKVDVGPIYMCVYIYIYALGFFPKVLGGV